MTYLVKEAIISPKIQQWREFPPQKNKGWANLALSPQWKTVLVIREDVLPSAEAIKKLIRKHIGRGMFFIWQPPFRKKAIIKRLVVE